MQTTVGYAQVLISLKLQKVDLSGFAEKLLKMLHLIVNYTACNVKLHICLTAIDSIVIIVCEFLST